MLPNHYHKKILYFPFEQLSYSNKEIVIVSKVTRKYSRQKNCQSSFSLYLCSQLGVSHSHSFTDAAGNFDGEVELSEFW